METAYGVGGIDPNEGLHYLLHLSLQEKIEYLFTMIPPIAFIILFYRIYKKNLRLTPILMSGTKNVPSIVIHPA